MGTTTKKLPNRKWLIAKDGKTIIFKTNIAHGYGWMKLKILH